MHRAQVMHSSDLSSVSVSNAINIGLLIIFMTKKGNCHLFCSTYDDDVSSDKKHSGICPTALHFEALSAGLWCYIIFIILPRHHEDLESPS